MRALLVCWLMLASGLALGAKAIPVSLALPGPGALPMLPLDLIPRIGADQAEGLQLTLRHFGGGPLALKDMLSGNSDFAALGMSALAATEDIGGKAYAVASVVQVPAYTLMASTRLRGQVKTLADLRGRAVGVHSASRAGKSTGQHIAEFLLKRAGVALTNVNFVNAGQSHAAYAAALQSGAVDAIIANEPAASRLEQEGIAFRLADLHDPATTRRYFGSLFQYTLLCARTDIIQTQGDKVRRMVAALVRALRWIDTHSAREIVARMDIADAKERKALMATLEKNKTMFSPDGMFSTAQLKGTAALLQAVADGTRAPPDLDTLIDARWVGRRP